MEPQRHAQEQRERAEYRRLHEPDEGRRLRSLVLLLVFLITAPVLLGYLIHLVRAWCAHF